MLATECTSSLEAERGRSFACECRANAERGRIRPGSTLSLSSPAVSGLRSAALLGRAGARIPCVQMCRGFADSADFPPVERLLAALGGRLLAALCGRPGPRPAAARALKEEVGRDRTAFCEYGGAVTIVGMSESPKPAIPFSSSAAGRYPPSPPPRW